MNVVKGARVRIRGLHTLPMGSWSLAGVQLKTNVVPVDFTGRVAHLRGDDPVNPVKVRMYVLPDGPAPEGLPATRPVGCSCPGHDQLIEVDPFGGLGIEVLS